MVQSSQRLGELHLMIITGVGEGFARGMPFGACRLEKKMPFGMMSWQQMVLIAGNLNHALLRGAGGT